MPAVEVVEHFSAIQDRVVSAVVEMAQDSILLLPVLQILEEGAGEAVL
jgi:hypothetical protein